MVGRRVRRCAALFVAVGTFLLACSRCRQRAETITFERDVVGMPRAISNSWGTGDAGPGQWAVV